MHCFVSRMSLEFDRSAILRPVTCARSINRESQSRFVHDMMALAKVGDAVARPGSTQWILSLTASILQS